MVEIVKEMVDRGYRIDLEPWLDIVYTIPVPKCHKRETRKAVKEREQRNDNSTPMDKQIRIRERYEEHATNPWSGLEYETEEAEETTLNPLSGEGT